MIDLTIAVILDFILGDPYGFPHPVIYIGKLISFLERQGRRRCRTARTLKLFGGCIVIAVCFVSFILPFVLLQWMKPFPILYHSINILLLWTTLAARCLHEEAIKVYKALKRKDIKEARIKLSYIVGRDTEDLQEEEIIRADVETVAENASDGVIAPLLYGIFGGAPLAMLYKAVNTMDSMLGYKNEKYLHIGFFPAKIDDVFNFIPARITGVAMCIVAPIVKGNILQSFKIMWRDRKNHKSPNCAYPEGAAAGALRIQLGGINRYFGEEMRKPTIGEAVIPLQKEHIVKTIYLMYGAEILILFLYVLLK